MLFRNMRDDKSLFEKQDTTTVVLSAALASNEADVSSRSINGYRSPNQANDDNALLGSNKGSESQSSTEVNLASLDLSPTELTCERSFL